MSGISTEANEGNEVRRDDSSSFPLRASVQSSTRHVIGIDVGGTKIAAGLIAFPEGRVLAQRLTPTDAGRGGRPVLDDALRLARELASADGRVDAIGLGVCELVDRDGRVASSNCIQWEDLPVREELGAIAPAVIEADVRAAALAEALFGAAKPFRTFLYVTVGTGISCCLMFDGRPFLGARGATGTMGSSPLSIPCEQCGHVSQRTLEDIAAGPALVKRFNELHGNAATGREVLAAAAAGDPVAAKIVQSAGEALESQVALLVNVLDPEAVVIGGGLGLSDGPYWDHFIASTRRHIWSELHRDLPILRAATGVDAGWIGAAARAWREFPNGSNLPQTLQSKP
jgi:glucokinase